MEFWLFTSCFSTSLQFTKLTAHFFRTKLTDLFVLSRTSQDLQLLNSQQGIKHTTGTSTTAGDGPNFVINVNDNSNLLVSMNTAIQKCSGLHITLPKGKSPHTTYPFALHSFLGNPWNYSMVTGTLILHACNCHKKMSGSDSQCFKCRLLAKNPSLIGIQDCIEKGTNKYCPFYYHGTGGTITLLQAKTNQI